MDRVFPNRRAAGRMLAAKLQPYEGRKDAVVLALPRGGVPVGYEVARALRIGLDVFVVRKLGVPGHEELAMGAIASSGVRVLNAEIIAGFALPPECVEAVAAREEKELVRRESLYRAGRPPLAPGGKIVILVDDGLATGATMRAAVEALRALKPSRIVAAVPVCSPEACAALKADADEVICLKAPDPFASVGSWYRDFPQTSDDEVRALLSEAE